MGISRGAGMTEQPRWRSLYRAMRFLRRFAPIGLMLTVTASAHAFNPGGRTKKPQKPTTSRPAQPKPQPDVGPQPDGPSSDALIDRYRKIVLEQPAAPFPLQRLAALYRDRDGNLDKLIAEFEAQVSKGGASQYNALLALAGTYGQANRIEQARETYDRAIALEPKNPLALLALGRLYEERSEKEKAKELFERALPVITSSQDKEQTLRLLMVLSLDTKDYPKARQFHEELVKLAKGSFFVRAELGRELLLRNEYAEAETELKALRKAAAGDNRALAPTLRDLGIALARQGKQQEALEVLERALSISQNESGIRRQVLETMVEVYRGQEKLPELVALLEKERGSDFQRMRLLAGLYEETGRIDDAIKTYRGALALNGSDIEVRLKLVQLLQIQGELDEAIAEHKALVKAAPHNPDFVLQLAEGLLQQGDRKGALSQLTQLERRAGNDEQTLAALVDFYERVGESDQAMRLLQRLSESGGGDPEHVIELGNRYYQDGETDKARATWKRVLVLVPNRARAQHTLGEVYLEHDMPEEALQALEEAVKLEPDERRYTKALALALERTGSGASKKVRRDRHDRARKLWEQLLKGAGSDHHLEQEARQHIVTLWSLSGVLTGRLKPLERSLAAKPPDLNSGRLLGEMYLRLRRNSDAERVLRVVTDKAPGDVASYLRLERVLVLQHKLPEAIEVLKRLVEAEPKRAREYYQRMSQYAAESYRDDEAIEYARKAVELSPDDANGHKNLAEMYRKRQDYPRAIAEYRQAIAKNDRLFPVYFELAEVLFSQEQHEEADRLLRRVMRSALDEELVSRATRLSMQINLTKKTLESLEQELLPIALANPHKPIYRRLLVEIYGALAFPLVQKAESPDAEVSSGARSELRRIGQRAVKPLLDALSDPRDAQQRVAIELLTLLENKSATAALYAYATSEAEPDLRVRAMIAAGAPADETMLPRFERLLSPDGKLRVDEGDPVSIAAVWGASRLDGAGATRLKMKLLEAESPSARALAALSLGVFRVHGAERELKEMLASPEQGPVARAAATIALGELGNFEQLHVLSSLTQSSDDRLRAAALTTLSRGGVKEVTPHLAEAIVYGKDSLRKAAIGAASVLAGAPFERHADPLGTPPSRIELEPILANFNARPPTPEQEAAALILLGDALATTCQAAVQSSAEQARTVADALLARAGAPAFGDLTKRIGELDPARRAEAEATSKKIAASVVGAFIALSSHPSARSRSTAIEFLSTRAEASARDALVGALSDDDTRVQRAALLGLQTRPHIDTLSGVSAQMATERPWATRLAATKAMAAYAKLEAAERKSPAFDSALSLLKERALRDEYSLVREAAVQSLFRLSPGVARPVLEQIVKDDPEQKVVDSAAVLLRSGTERNVKSTGAPQSP